MTGELYTCCRCNKRRFVPTTAHSSSLPEGWMVICNYEPFKGTVGPDYLNACEECSEVYNEFKKRFMENRDFSMKRTKYHEDDIMGKEVQNGSEQASEELDPDIETYVGDIDFGAKR